MSRKLHLFAALVLLLLALTGSPFAGTPAEAKGPGVGDAPQARIFCPYISPRCCATETGPSGCPFCTCYFPSPCC